MVAQKWRYQEFLHDDGPEWALWYVLNSVLQLTTTDSTPIPASTANWGRETHMNAMYLTLIASFNCDNNVFVTVYVCVCGQRMYISVNLYVYISRYVCSMR